jgi:pimeloyl-ACP methyl ester carboxylesterase
MRGTWTQAVVAGKKVDLYDPPGPGKPRLAILFLHGVGLETLIGNDVFTGLFADLNLACASAHGQRAWWTDRICSEFDPEITGEQHLLKNVLPFMRQRWLLPDRGVGLMGVSMGGQGALRVAFKHPEQFPVVAGIAPALDYHEWYGHGYSMDEMYDSKEQCRQDTAIMHVPPYGYPPHIFFCVDPDDSDWCRGNDRLHEKLTALGIPHTCDLTTRAGGHSWDYYNALADRAVRFVHAGLEQESRRLL